jgi:thiamine pyrophosphokinase
LEKIHISIIVNGIIAKSFKPDSGEIIICADGAANKLRDLEIVPNVIIGDLDSILKENLEWFIDKCNIIKLTDQYSTDLEKALKLALLYNASCVDIYGTSGGRLDHTLSNLSILYKFKNNFSIHVIEDKGWGFFVDAEKGPVTVVFSSKPKEIISLIPMQKVCGITTSGLMYPLIDESLIWGKSEGQSNQAVAEEIRISISSGVLFIFVCGAVRLINSSFG